MVRISENTYLSHDSSFFYLEIIPKSDHVVMKMQLKTPYVNTRFFPKTYELLSSSLPSVLNTKCFNEANLPFRKEVRTTEIGHLFEHILLEYLCLEKYKTGSCKVVFNGKTKWNWIVNKYGSFEITVDVGFSDISFLVYSLRKAINLTEKILSSEMVAYEGALHSKFLLTSLPDHKTIASVGSGLPTDA